MGWVGIGWYISGCNDQKQSKTKEPPSESCRMNYALTEEMTGRGVDLLVLEGMGRAVHTNLYTK